MEPLCPRCAQPEPTILRLVLLGELLCAEETPLRRLAAVMHACGLLQDAPTPGAPASLVGRTRKATRASRQQPRTPNQS